MGRNICIEMTNYKMKEELTDNTINTILHCKISIDMLYQPWELKNQELMREHL